MKSYIERAIELAKSKRTHVERSQDPVDGQPDAGARDNVKRRRPQAIAHALTNGHPASSLPPIDLVRSHAVVTDGGLLRHNRVLVDSDTLQPAANAYRMLRTRVMRQMRMNGWRRLGITAAVPGEGKTLTAINLALAIAAERVQPVVLIDMDLRRPRVYQYLGIDKSQFTNAGDYLEGRTSSLDQLVVTLSEQV